MTDTATTPGGRPRLTDDQVHELRRRHIDDGETVAALADEYGCSYQSAINYTRGCVRVAAGGPIKKGGEVVELPRLTPEEWEEQRRKKVHEVDGSPMPPVSNAQETALGDIALQARRHGRDLDDITQSRVGIALDTAAALTVKGLAVVRPYVEITPRGLEVLATIRGAPINLATSLEGVDHHNPRVDPRLALAAAHERIRHLTRVTARYRQQAEKAVAELPQLRHQVLRANKEATRLRWALERHGYDSTLEDPLAGEPHALPWPAEADRLRALADRLEAFDPDGDEGAVGLAAVPSGTSTDEETNP